MHQKSKRQVAKAEKIAAWSKLDPAVFKKAGISRKRATEFESNFDGDMVWPWDAPYNQDRQQADPAFNEFPVLIAYCKSYSDIAYCLGLAQENNLTVTCRSGGHSTAGYSVITGTITIDMSRYFNYVNVDQVSRTAHVGAGTPFDTLDTKLEPYGLHVPGGECSDVCVGGYSQGGGYGFTARQYSINSDNILEVTVMSMQASGPQLIVANANQNQDLYWAVRGGTGNNYGVLIDIKYQLYPVGVMWGFTLKWTNPTDILNALQMIQNQYALKAPPELGFQAVLMIQAGDSAPSFQLSGIYNGSANQGMSLIAPLVRLGNPTYKTYTGLFRYLNDTILPEPNLPPNFNGIPPEVKESRYISTPIDANGWQQIVNYFFNQRPAWNVTNAVFFEYYGGRINQVPTYANAFVHRNSYMDIYVDSFWYNDTQKAAAETWLDGYMTLINGYSNGEQYQNYPRRNTSGYQWAFWKNGIYTLAAVKAKYDPLGLLNFPMSAVLPKDKKDPVYTQVKRADQKSLFPKRKIIADKSFEKLMKAKAENKQLK